MSIIVRTIPVQPTGQPDQQPPGVRRPPMRTGTGIFLITTGAVLLFALRAGSPHWLNLHVVGVILILVGALGLLLPRLGRGQPHFDRLRRWERPGQPRDLDGASAGARPRGDDSRQPPATSTSLPGDSPTLVDDLLSFEHPLL